MIKFELDAKAYDRIIKYESEYLSEFSHIVQDFQEAFAMYGCTINYGLFWFDAKGKICKERPAVDNKYACWYWYEIIKDGQLVCCDETEGYTLGIGEGFLYVSKKRNGFFKKPTLEVTFIDDYSDIKKYLNEDYILVQKNFKVEYN